MKTNTKTNTVLEKKLEELECLLEESGFGNGDLNAYREIEHRFIFTKTLLTAEISSVKDDEEEERLKLACMAKRLTELEEAFDNQYTGSINEPDMRGLESGGVLDETGSACGLDGLSPREYQDALLEEKVEDAVVERETDEIKKKRFRGVVSFGIFGFITGMVSYFVYIYNQMSYEDTIFLSPT